VWLPALCRKMGVPYAIVKGKARLGQLVHKKTATAVAFKNIHKADQGDFSALTRVITEKYFGESADKLRRKWGGNKVGPKARAARAAFAAKKKSA
jgi:large subunit ribosomal protein L7Ae